MHRLLPHEGLSKSEVCDVEIRATEAPPPEPKQFGKNRDAVFTQLAKMKVNEGVEINRRYWSMVQYVYRFRVLYGRELRFIVRPAKEFGWVRVWRVR